MDKPEPTTGYILLVDDVIENLNMLTDMLQHQGHTIDVASNGKDALEQINKKEPDIILLDIQMPGMTGYDVCREIRANPETAHIPVIFLSALIETADIVKAFDAGGNDYVSKPFKYREVMARVESQLKMAHQRQEIQALRERDKHQFEALAKMKNNFLYSAAHDLKNPLTGMLLYTQVLRMTPPENVADLEELAQGIENTARKMQRLTMDILDLAQMQVGDQMQMVEQALQPIFHNTVKNLEVLAKEKDIKLDLQLLEETIIYPVEASYFERMLDNLVSNAIKYTPEGGDVLLALQDYDTHYEISVRDTGIGIPENDLPNLFDAFYRVKSDDHKKENGTGLGLSIVAAIVDEHGGEIIVESVVDEGSTFIVILPKTS